MIEVTVPANELDAHCNRQFAIVSLQPQVTRGAGPPPPRTRNAEGFAPHLVIDTGLWRPKNEGWSYSTTKDESLHFGADPGSYVLRMGWKVQPEGGSITFRAYHLAENDEPVPFKQRFELTVRAPRDELLIPPGFGRQDPAAYTHIQVLQGLVIDESGLAVPLFKDLSLAASYFAFQDALYQWVITV